MTALSDRSLFAIHTTLQWLLYSIVMHMYLYNGLHGVIFFCVVGEILGVFDEQLKQVITTTSVITHGQ